MKIAILGFARDGRAAFEFFSSKGHELTICDQDLSLSYPQGTLTQLGENYLKNLDQFDLIVRTAGLAPHLIVEANPENPDIMEKVTGNIDLFFENSPTKNIIGVTGTKGKGTTSTLISEMLKAAGKKVHLGGNIGIPALELVKEAIEESDWVVLEQSSFQLMDQRHSPHIAVCLMVVPEHLDWHVDMDEYLDAKSQLFIHQRSEDIAIYCASSENAEMIANASEGNIIPYMESPGAQVLQGNFVIDNTMICPVSNMKLLGKHNQQNICAAITTVWQVTKDVRAIRSVVESFTGLEYRLQFEREVQGVKYYNDSFGTTPDTAIVAADAFVEMKVMIVGGSDKGVPFNQLAKRLAENDIRHVIFIGSTGGRIKELATQEGLSDERFTIKDDGNSWAMSEIVEVASRVAQTGDIVLLSTGCASFGLFSDYKDRGMQYHLSVANL